VLTESGGYTQDLTDTKISRQWSLGGGIGAYFGHAARFDATYERRFKADVSGTFLFDHGGANQASVRGTNQLDSAVLLANFYYDFNRGSRFNPYLGVGLGAVHHNVGAGTFSSSSGVTGTIDGNSSWHAAGALMAGLDLKLRDRLHLDAGYRFLYLGHTSTGATKVTINRVVMPIAQDPTIEQIHAHEFRVGLRYDIQ
jgi:opacity protein-like surface antigen